MGISTLQSLSFTEADVVPSYNHGTRNSCTWDRKRFLQEGQPRVGTGSGADSLHLSLDVCTAVGR